MGSIAARLTGAGMPAVLAMSHAVLVSTTRQLFGEFYRQLAQGRAIGTALDNARRLLYSHPDKHEVQRGAHRITLQLQDWFVPALYQAGEDRPLLRSKGHASATPERRPVCHNLPVVQEVGFFGRQRELWDIERWLTQGTRRITITGFGGQGKTSLVQEAGRWLLRTSMFSHVVFVGYASYQGADPVGYALSMLATVLQRSLPDANAATEALRQCRCLVILDNLEALAEDPLRELLEIANRWSEESNCRVLLTSRMPELPHVAYPRQGSLRHRTLSLKGLDEEEALNYFQALMKLPPPPQTPFPARDGLLNLFRLVDFHPLSITVLAQELKTRRVAELGERLQTLVAKTPGNLLLASLNLSLEQLPPEVQRWLPRLGVFQGGAFDPEVLAITESSEPE
jgi:CHAT domain